MFDVALRDEPISFELLGVEPREPVALLHDVSHTNIQLLDALGPLAGHLSGDVSALVRNEVAFDGFAGVDGLRRGANHGDQRTTEEHQLQFRRHVSADPGRETNRTE